MFYSIEYKGNNYLLENDSESLLVFHPYIEEILNVNLSKTQVKEVFESDDYIHGYKISVSSDRIILSKQEEIIDVGYFWNGVKLIEVVIAEFKVLEEKDITPSELVKVEENKEEIHKSKVYVNSKIYRQTLYNPVIEELNRHKIMNQ